MIWKEVFWPYWLLSYNFFSTLSFLIVHRTDLWSKSKYQPKINRKCASQNSAGGTKNIWNICPPRFQNGQIWYQFQWGSKVMFMNVDQSIVKASNNQWIDFFYISEIRKSYERRDQFNITSMIDEIQKAQQSVHSKAFSFVTFRNVNKVIIFRYTKYSIIRWCMWHASFSKIILTGSVNLLITTVTLLLRSFCTVSGEKQIFK